LNIYLHAFSDRHSCEMKMKKQNKYLVNKEIIMMMMIIIIIIVIIIIISRTVFRNSFKQNKNSNW